MEERARSVPTQELLSAVGTLLAEGRTAELTTVGASMEPLLPDGRSVVRLSAPGTLRRGDVILYRAPDGRFLLHRLVRIRNGELLCRGDRNLRTERGILPASVTAVMTDFDRGAGWVSCSSLRYRLYWHFRLASYPVRLLAHRVKRFLRK